MTVFLRILEPAIDEKAEELLRGVAALRDPSKVEEGFERVVFEGEPQAFGAVPGSPFAYWVSEETRRMFRRFPPFEAAGRRAIVGVATGDDSRYLRCFWEVSVRRVRWRLFAKGGSFSPYYADLYLVIDWLKEGVPIELSFVGGRVRKPDFFRAGLTWPMRTNGLSFRALPRDSIFAHKGPAAFVDGDSPRRLFALSALLNSRTFGYLVSVQLARTELAQSYEVGLIQQTPIPDLSEEESAHLARLAYRAWSLKRSLDTSNETSHAFVLPTLLIEKVNRCDRVDALRELESIASQIDEAAFRLYDVVAKDRAAIERSSNGAIAGNSFSQDSGDEDNETSEDGPTVAGATDTLVSWLVGVTFGRFDSRLATGERAFPAEPEPFDPLPARSPGMWPEGEEPAERPDILVDDEGHSDDLATRVTNIAERVGVQGRLDLRRWLARDFFPLHIRMYSKSRRKAPIYWQLATPAASYSVWLYIHAFTKDTLYRVQNDYVIPKLAHEERKLESMTRERDKATAQERKQLASQEVFVDELRGFMDEVRRVAPLWNPDLDDGVIINFAPLWRLVPHHKPWQKELKATWDALCEGEYDWAHLAMHLWPERVVPTCATDRSLAIAHGLEEVFWVEGAGGKWIARETPLRPIEELVRERTSPAVKAALRSLLEAPSAAGTGSKSKKGKANA